MRKSFSFQRYHAWRRHTSPRSWRAKNGRIKKEKIGMKNSTQEFREEKTSATAEQELKKLQMKYDELGRAYDAIQEDLVFLLNENRRLKEELRKR